jgi:hypothetical protein
VNTAKDLDTPGPDFRKGFGSVRMMQALHSVEENNLTEDTLLHGEAKEFIIHVPGKYSFT